MTFDFSYSLYLLLLLIPVLILTWAGWRRGVRDLHRLDISVGGRERRSVTSTFLWGLHFAAILLVLGFSVLALAGPRWGRERTYVDYTGTDIIFCIDISNSMLARDLDVTRLQEAKNIVFRVMDEMPDALTGVALFKGDGILTIPLTEDRSLVQQFIGNAGPKLQTAPGTNIEKGLLAAADGFPPGNSRRNMICLFTDGESTSGDPRGIIPRLRENDIRVWSFITGTEEGGEIELDSGKVRISRAVPEAADFLSAEPGNETFTVDLSSWNGRFEKQLKTLSAAGEGITLRETVGEKYYIFLLAALCACGICSYIRIRG